jgi:hypothetical protein
MTEEGESLNAMSDVRARISSACVLIDKEGQRFLYSDVMSVCARVRACVRVHQQYCSTYYLPLYL